jgi:peptidyl-prolyl cis-trans isomerase C
MHCSKSFPRSRATAFALLVAGLMACAPGSNAQEAQPAAPEATAGGQSAAQPPAAGEAAVAPSAPAPTVTADKIPAVVAKVNGQEIKKEDLLAQLRGVQGPGADTGNINPEAARQVLDALIARSLLRQEAIAQGVTVTDDEVKQQIDQLRRQFPSPEAFGKALEAEGMTEESLLQKGRQEYLIQKYVETKIAPKVTVSDEAAKSFYDENTERMQTPERLHLRHILVAAQPEAPAEEKQKAKTEAEALAAKVKAGEDFAALAKEHSDDPGSKPNGGDLNWVAKGQTVEPFEQAAWGLKDGEVSGVVETRFGYHLIQRLETQAAGVVPFEQVKDRIRGFLTQRQTQQAVQAEVEALKAKGKVETYL